MPNNSFRAFFAIDIPEDIKKAISIAIKPLRSHYTMQQIKWVKEKNWHITLCFLGNISEQQYQCIDKKIKDVIKAIKKFNIELTTPQPFPSAENFHIVSLKPEASTALNSLALAIKNSVATCGIQTEDRPFCPHLTLGRINDRHKIDGEILRTIKLPAMSFEVSAIKLFKSEPQPAGSVYTVVATYVFYKINMKSRLLNLTTQAKTGGYRFAIFLILILINQGACAMKLTSPAFTDGGALPAIYTCDGKSISPPIQWQDAPANTKSFALIYDDPDAPAGTWVHWILYNLPSTTNSLAENVSALPPGTKVGTNSWPQAKYGAPCPPSGEHRYIFHLYALDTMLNLSGTVTSETLQQEMQGHILASTTLLGRYTRKKITPCHHNQNKIV